MDTFQWLLVVGISFLVGTYSNLSPPPGKPLKP